MTARGTLSGRTRGVRRCDGEPPSYPSQDAAIRPHHLALALAALLCTAPALPAAPPATTPVRPAAVHPVPTPAPTARPSPSPVPPATPTVPEEAAHATHRVAVRVEGAPTDAASRARDLDGVVHVATIRVGRLAVGSGGDELTVASVDPAAYRPFAPGVVADDPGVWARLAEGELAVTHEHAQRLGLDLAGHVVLGGTPGVPVRVGALASNGVPPVAQAIVGRATGTRLGLDAVPTTLLVAVADDVDPAHVADVLGQRLGVSADVVPDPRAPTPVTPAPARGDTVWDVLAACESSGDWHANTGNGYYGGLQFLPESWWMVGGQGLPHEASREEQIARAERLLAVQGWVAWPVCSVRVGLPVEGQP